MTIMNQMNVIFSKRERYEILLSPILVILIGHVTARVAGQFLGSWAWLPLTLVFWSTIGVVCYRYGGFGGWRDRFGDSRGAWGWAAFALLVGLLPLPIFLMNWKLLLSFDVFIMWLIFGLVNPWIEEGYWRGLLLDATTGWPTTLRVLYTAGVFAMSHPLMFGVNSIGVASTEVLVSTFVMGIIWALIYLRTRSLRWCVASHVLVDLLSLSVPVFMNQYIPR
jgi:uncharacterized protein